MFEVDRKFTVEISYSEAETLVGLFENYLTHYTEDEHYTGDEKIPALLVRIVSEMASND